MRGCFHLVIIPSSFRLFNVCVCPIKTRRTTIVFHQLRNTMFLDIHDFGKDQITFHDQCIQKNSRLQPVSLVLFSYKIFKNADKEGLLLENGVQGLCDCSGLLTLLLPVVCCAVTCNEASRGRLICMCIFVFRMCVFVVHMHTCTHPHICL